MISRQRPWHRSTRSTWLLSLVIAMVVSTWVAAPRAANGAAPDPTPSTAAALAWLARELDDHGGTLPGFSPGTTEWGLTMDAVLAFGAAGAQGDPAAIAATDRVATAEAVTTYTTWDPGVPGVRVAGATAKTLLTLRTMGRPTTVDGVDLEAELRSLVVASGTQRGRVADRVPDPAWDASNGFSQALAMLALAMTPGRVPDHSVGFLVAQQCPSGGFPLTYDAGGRCTDDATADPDASALAVQALLGVERTAPVRTALERSVTWLLSRQGADGSFGGTGPTAGANANSTGVIAQTLRAAGATDAADLAATWITSQVQLDAAAVSGTPATGEIGAIAYAPAARTTALAEGIADASADQWRRSTTQAVLALGSAPYGPHDVEPLAPLSTTTTTVTPASSAPASTAAPTTAVPSTTTPTTVTPATMPGTPSTAPATQPTGQTGSPVADGVRQDMVTGSAAGSAGAALGSTGSRSTTGSLPRTGPLPWTGADTDALVAAGVTAIGAGAMLLVSRRRRPRSTAGRG